MIFSIGVVSAMTIDFYYSPSCPYCQQIKPTVEWGEELYPSYEFNYYNVQTPKGELEYKKQNFGGVPAFKITTDDCREIKFTGANDYKLNCELQQMSTLNCQTYQAGFSTNGSWFID